MIELTTPGGMKVLLNPYHVFTIEDITGRTRITSVSGAVLIVAEQLDLVELAITRMLKP